MEEGRNTAVDTADIGMRDLMDYCFPPLKVCLQWADVGAFMCSYNAINGTPSCGNQWLNVQVVREAWGWDGVIEYDCGALSGMIDHE